MTFATVKARNLFINIIPFPSHWFNLFIVLDLNNFMFVLLLISFKQGAGHVAPEFKREECFNMFKRWISHDPL